jgi:hypothetical protein
MKIIAKLSLSLLLILLILGCNKQKDIHYNYPNFYAAIKCKKSNECLTIDGKSILKKQILKLSVKKAFVIPEGLSFLLNKDSAEEFFKMKQDNADIFIYLKEKLIGTYKVKSKRRLSNIILAYNNFTPEELLITCKNIFSPCTLARYKEEIKKAATRKFVIEKQIKKGKYFKNLNESYKWRSSSETVQFYESSKSTFVKAKVLATKITLMQSFDSKKNKFIYKHNRVKFKLGWVSRKFITPVNPTLNINTIRAKLTSLLQQKKCYPKKVKLITSIHAMTRSQMMAIKSMNLLDYEATMKLLRKNIKKYKCK